MTQCSYHVWSDVLLSKHGWHHSVAADLAEDSCSICNFANNDCCRLSSLLTSVISLWYKLETLATSSVQSVPVVFLWKLYLKHLTRCPQLTAVITGWMWTFCFCPCDICIFIPWIHILFHGLFEPSLVAELFLLLHFSLEQPPGSSLFFSISGCVPKVTKYETIYAILF